MPDTPPPTNPPAVPPSPRGGPPVHRFTGSTVLVRIDAAGLADDTRSIGGPVSVWVECPADPHAAPGAPAPIGVPAHPHDAGRCLVHRIATTPGEGETDPRTPFVIDRTDAVLIPGLVNAHCHLDLTGLGPRPHDPGVGFVDWIGMIIADRPTEPAAVRDAIADGVRLSLAGGVVAVGDIIGAANGVPTTSGLSALAESPLEGVGFIEYFGIAVRTIKALSVLHDLAHELAAWPAGTRIRPGLHPHAPNTVSLPLYNESATVAERDGFPISTHLAESPEERAFVAEADGPQRDLLDRLGIWDDRERAHIGFGKHPVEHLARVLGRRPFLCAHVNDADDAAIATLARTGASVAYCPRASAYFGAPGHFGPHRFAEMNDAGVRVCLGTDSIVNLDTPDRISPLDDARLLARTTATDSRTLLGMMTTQGAAALGLDAQRYRFSEHGPIAGIVAVPIQNAGAPIADPADVVLRSDSTPELLLC